MTAVLERGEAGDGTESMVISRGWDDPPVLVSLAVIVLAAVWLGTLVRPEPPGDSSPEAGFARDMLVHHAQAVEMAELARFRTQDPAVRTLATDIALTQQAQIGQVRGWLDVWGLPVTRRAPAMAWMGHPTAGLMPGMATPAQVRALSTGPPAEADVAFLQAMIPHHRAAVAMAEAVLERTGRDEVRRLAAGIVAAQRSEIRGMQDLLRVRGAPVDVRSEVSMPEDTAGGHGGFFASVGATWRSTVRLAPLAAGAVALGWLAADGWRRCREWMVGAAPRREMGRWRWAAAAGLAVAGALHLGLAPAHLDEAFAYGAFFAVAAVAQLVLAPVVVVAPCRSVGAAAALGAALLTVVYLGFRLVAPPGAGEPESIDAVGVTVQLAQLAVVAAGTALARRAPAGRSL